MTQVGEGHGGWHAGESMTLGAPAVGEILAERYQLEQHVNSDSAGRQIWRGVDVLLRRQVAVVMRYPGGQPAAEMLQAAVDASRIVHPNLAGVYDAIDEGGRAYVVREWVDGVSLRDQISAELFDAARATTVAHAVAAATTAVHGTGMSHGNIHPGTIMIGLDGRVVLTDASADGAGAPEEDVRSVGAVLYFALTGYWPHEEVPGPGGLADAPRDSDGIPVSPRQIQAGVPAHLDNLTMDLLDRRLAVPPAEVLTGEFARLDTDPEDESFFPARDEPAAARSAPVVADAGPLRLSGRDDPPRPSGRKIALGVAALAVIAVLGLVVGINVFSGSDPDVSADSDDTGNTAPIGDDDESPSDDETASPRPLELSASQLRIVDPPRGDRTELSDVDLIVDGDLSTAWRTDGYNQPGFGNLKPGMGVLIDLGEPRRVASVTVNLSSSGASAELRTGDSDPGDSSSGDEEIAESFTRIGEPLNNHDGTTMVFSGFEADETYQYLMLWVTELPPDPSSPGRYRIEVQQVTVEGY